MKLTTRLYALIGIPLLLMCGLLMTCAAEIEAARAGEAGRGFTDAAKDVSRRSEIDRSGSLEGEQANNEVIQLLLYFKIMSGSTTHAA